MKKVLNKIWKKLGWFGNLGLIFSSLSAISKLKTWQDIYETLTGISDEILSILDFFGRLIEYILFPYQWLTSKLFQVLPFEVSESWHDPVVVGFFVILIPFNEIINLYNKYSTIAFNRAIKKLKYLGNIIPDETNREKIGAEINKLIQAQDEFFAGMMSGPPLYYLQALYKEDNLDEIQELRLEFKDYLKSESFKIVVSEEDKEANRKYMKRSRLKGVIAFILLLLLSIESIYLGQGFTFFSIIWRSLLIMLLMSLTPILGLIVIFLMLKVLSKGVDKLLTLIIGEEKVDKLRWKLWGFISGLMTPHMPNNWKYAKITSKTISKNKLEAIPWTKKYEVLVFLDDGSIPLLGEKEEGVIVVFYDNLEETDITEVYYLKKKRLLVAISKKSQRYLINYKFTEKDHNQLLKYESIFLFKSGEELAIRKKLIVSK